MSKVRAGGDHDIREIQLSALVAVVGARKILLLVLIPKSVATVDSITWYPVPFSQDLCPGGRREIN